MVEENEKYKWFIAHVAYRSELKVKDILDTARINYYMPFTKVFRTWNGSRNEIQIPALPSCVFIRVEESDLAMLLLMREISFLLDREGKPVCLAEEKMNEAVERLNSSENKGEIVLQLIDDLIHR